MFFAGFILSIWVAIAAVWLRFSNPELTDAQIVIQYWECMVAIAVVQLIAIGLIWKGKI